MSAEIRHKNHRVNIVKEQVIEDCSLYGAIACISPSATKFSESDLIIGVGKTSDSARQDAFERAVNLIDFNSR